jgi:hypothetical protein
MTDNQNTAVAIHEPRMSSGGAISVFSSEAAFTSAQRICGALVKSDLVPATYRGMEKMGNAMIALDLANRMSIAPLMVMQNLHIIEGRPSWASSFIIAALNSCGLFSPLRFDIKELGTREVSYEKWSGPKDSRRKETVKAKVEDIEFRAYAVEKATGEILKGPKVSIGMAVAEGWYFKPGSKWVTMPELMGRYRAAAFFGRLYAPHILNGMQTADEIVDVEYEVIPPASTVAPTVATEADRPAERPQAVHAALQTTRRTRAKAKPEAEPAPAPEAEAEADNEIEDAEVVEDVATDDDVFGAPGDDDYQPD